MAFFEKRLRFDYVTLLECGDCFSLDPIPFCSHTKHIRNASWGNVARPIHCCVLPVRACVQVPSTISGERYLFQLLLFVPRT